MAKKNYTCGIDIGTDTIKLVLSTIDPQTETIRVETIAQVPSVGVRRGYIVNVDEVANCIKKAVLLAQNTAGFKIHHCFTSISGINLSSTTTIGQIITTRADQEVTMLDINRAIENAQENIDTNNHKIIQTIPLAFKLDNKEVHGRVEGMKGVKLEARVLSVVCLKQNIEDLATSFELAGIELLDILACVNANTVSSVKQRTAGCAVVDIGAQTVSVAVYDNNLLISTHVFPIGSTDITRDIALGLKIDLEEAEKIKTGSIVSSDFSKKKVEEIINARLEDIFEVVGNYLKKIKRNELLPGGIIIIGGGSRINTVSEIAKSQLKLPTRIGHTEEFINTHKFKLYDGLWYTALGLSMQKLNTNQKHINFTSNKDLISKTKIFFKKILSELLP